MHADGPATWLQALKPEMAPYHLAICCSPALNGRIFAISPAAGWDLFGLEYDLDEPLATAVTPRAMAGYRRLSRCGCPSQICAELAPCRCPGNFVTVSAE